MNPPPQPPPHSSPSTARREILIQGPRPTPLRLSKDSVKIKKPPRAPLHQPTQHTAPYSAPPPPNQPVIIYSVSPKPILVEASDFLTLVQQLTGRNTSPPETSTATGVRVSGEAPPSPAARLAAYERTSPKEGEWRRGGDVNMPVEWEGEVMRQMPGILSPAPGNLPVISAAMFSPAAAATEGSSFMEMSGLMSPFMNNYNMAFTPSPSALLFNNAPFVSPSSDFFNIFDF